MWYVVDVVFVLFCHSKNNLYLNFYKCCDISQLFLLIQKCTLSSSACSQEGSTYSRVPNSSAVPIKRAGWKKIGIKLFCFWIDFKVSHHFGICRSNNGKRILISHDLCYMIFLVYFLFRLQPMPSFF